MMSRYPCPSCGYLVFDLAPGSEAICPICGWLDDLMHLRFVLFDGRPNGISLLEAQRNFVAIGAKDAHALRNVRFPVASDVRDPDWRPVDLDQDEPESIPNDFDGLSYPQDPTLLYYWSPRYFRRSAV
ncbi:MAG: CPCC family cysteine-rich protein [Vulcanimicrobiaceae bacterium]